MSRSTSIIGMVLSAILIVPVGYVHPVPPGSQSFRPPSL